MLWGERVKRRRALVGGVLVLGLVAQVAFAVVLLGHESGRAAPVALPLHPVAGSFVPDSTSLAQCRDQRCFEQALGNVAYREGPKAALALLETVYGDGATPACHRAVHTIGAASLARYDGNVSLTFAEGSAECWSGYYHGVLERALLGVDSYEPDALASVARPLCAGSREMIPWIAYQCFHGLGHGLMITTGLDLPRSLAVCRRLDARWDRSACKGGVFMENIAVSYGYRSRWLRDDDPVYPCNTVARADKWRCYQMVTSRILPSVSDDWGRAAGVCARVERDFVSVCFLSLGRDASSRSSRDAASIVATCAVARPYGGEDECISGAARDMTANDMSARRARGLCEMQAADLAPSCYFGIGTVLGAFRKTDALRARDCRSLVSAPRLVSACTSGGRSALPRS